MAGPRPLDFQADGAQLFAGALTPSEVADVSDRLDPAIAGRPGRRLLVDDATSAMLSSNGPIGSIAGRVMGGEAFPVRVVLFDKTLDANWMVAWHQDRTIAVKSRHAVPGYGPWTMKDGLAHVMPPISVLERMATLRLHLDPCGTDNAPLQIARGSHRIGLVASDRSALVAMSHDIFTCHAGAGDVWAYSTPILHASAKSASARRRRVLQIDYATDRLDAPLEWLGVDQTPA